MEIQERKTKICLIPPKGRCVMSLAVVLFFLLSTVITGNAMVKNIISLKLDNVPMSQAFEKVEELSGYKMTYTMDEVQNYNVTCNLTNNTIQDVMRTLLKNTPMDFSVKGEFITVFSTKKSSGVRNKKSKYTLSGMVVDAKDEPLAGVTVIAENAKQGVVTNNEGNFMLSVPADSKVVFSYIGMKPYEMTVTDDEKVKIVLEDNVQLLSNVVVTGYQTINKEKVTGAITALSSDKLEERYTPNILDNLEGRVAGLSTYGGKPIIRGVGTLYGSTQPLLVVDGMPIEGSIEDVNPYNIESVNVLKDAAAAAIYGARAANGIIVITTKNAKKKGKIDIDFSTNITVYEKKNMDYADNFYMTPSQQVDLESDYWNYYFFDNDGEVADPIKTIGNSIAQGSNTITPIQWDYYQKALGNITDGELASRLASYKQNNFAKDFSDAMYKTRVLQQYNLALRSSSEVSRNNFLLNYKYDNTGLINSDSQWLNVSYKGSFDLSGWLTATVGINGIYAQSKEWGECYQVGTPSAWTMPAYMPFYNADGTIRKLYYWYSGNEYWTIQEGVHDLGVNLVEETLNDQVKTRRQNMRYHGDLLFKIIKGLTVNAQFIYEAENIEIQRLANEKSVASRTLRNAYTTFDYTTGKIGYLTPENGGFLQTTNTNGNYWTARGQINYSNTFGKHDIAAIAGLEFRQTKYRGTKSLCLGYDDQLQSSSTQTVDLGTLSQMRYSSYYMADNYGFPAQQFVFNPYISDAMGLVTEVTHRYASGYANLTYTFDERYNVFGSFRKDYADVYGLNSKFRGKPLWSVGAGWNIHKEAFTRDFTSWLSFARLRASYGVTGNIYQGATSYMTASSTDLNNYTNMPMGVVQSPANPNLRWEQSRTTNVGLDYGFFNYRLRGSIDYYNKISKDVFNNQPLDPTTGFSSMFANVASMRNRGIELGITYDWFVPNNRKGFSWTTSFTFSHNSNIVTDVENDATSAWQLIQTPYVKGKPASAMWSYRFAGISDQPGMQGQTLWEVENNGTSHYASGRGIEVLEYSGQADPKVMMGMDNTFRWNGFSLGILMAYYGGHKVRALAETETLQVPASAIASYFLNAWTPENPTNTPGIGRYASMSIGSEPSYSNLSVHDADFLKIRNIVVGYDIPRDWLHRFCINACTLRFQINNPKAIWVKNDVGIDPETLGIRNPSSFVFGLNINL